MIKNRALFSYRLFIPGILVVLLGLCFSLASCGDFQEVTFSGIIDVKIIKLSQNGVEAEITARIKNPNKMSFVIYKSEMDVTLNGINAGKANLTKKVKLKANSEEDYLFAVKSDFSGLAMTDIPKVISMAMSKNVKIGMKGNLRVGKLLVKKNFPVDMSQSVPLNGLMYK